MSIDEKKCEEGVRSAPVKEVLLSNSSVMQSASCMLPENRAKTLLALQKQHSFDCICGCSTSCSKALLARFSAVLSVPMLTDVISVVNESTFQRFVYAGNAVETVKVESKPLVRLAASRDG